MGSIAELSDCAAALASDALDVLAQLMCDQQQSGPVRVSAAKGVMDYALKLDDREHGGGLVDLDAALEQLRTACIEGQA